MTVFYHHGASQGCSRDFCYSKSPQNSESSESISESSVPP